MPQTPLAPKTRRTRLEGVRVSELMTPNPLSVRHGITVRDAACSSASGASGLPRW